MWVYYRRWSWEDELAEAATSLVLVVAVLVLLIVLTLLVAIALEGWHIYRQWAWQRSDGHGHALWLAATGLLAALAMAAGLALQPAFVGTAAVLAAWAFCLWVVAIEVIAWHAQRQSNSADHPA
jgi:hypothetical protein